MTCVVCGESGEIDRGERVGDDWVALCEFCYLNMGREDTVDALNRFYLEG